MQLFQTLDEPYWIRRIRIWFSLSLAEQTDLTRLSPQSSRRIVKQDSKSCQGRVESASMSPRCRSWRQKSRKSSRPLPIARGESRKIFSRGLSGHQKFLIGEMRRGRFVGDKGELEVGDDTIDHRIVGEEGNDAHFSLAFGTGQGINLIDLNGTTKISQFNVCFNIIIDFYFNILCVTCSTEYKQKE